MRDNVFHAWLALSGRGIYAGMDLETRVRKAETLIAGACEWEDEPEAQEPEKWASDEIARQSQP